MAKDTPGFSQFVYASSASVYGNTDSQTGVLSPYALEKKTVEMYASLFRRLYGLSSVGLRYFNVYGPRQSLNPNTSGVIPLFLHHARTQQPLVIFGNGYQTRDFVHVSDVVRANVAACLQDSTDPSSHVLDIRSGVSTSILDLAKLIQRSLGVEIPIEFSPSRSGEVSHSRTNILDARTCLDYNPLTSLQDGLNTLFEWSQSHSE